MAIASNIFKQLIYVPEGTTIGVVDADSASTQFGSTVTVATAGKVGEDEVAVSFTGTGTTVLNKGSKVTFTGDTNVYYLTKAVSTAAAVTTGTLVLDRPLAAAVSTVVAVVSYTSPDKSNQPRALRRVSSNLSPKYDTYASNEIRSDQQVADYRIGSKTIDGTLSCELSSRTYEDFFAALLRKDFYSPVVQTFASAITTATGTGIVVGLGNTNVLKLTFAVGDVGSVSGDAGSTTADKFTGIKVGEVFQLTPSGTTTATINTLTTAAGWAAVPLLVLAKDSVNRVLTVVAANDPASVAFNATGSIPANSTIQVLGRKSFVPLTNHLQKSFQFEHFYSDLSAAGVNATGKPIAELFTGCRVTQGAIKLPTSGVATCDFSVMGIGSKVPTDVQTLWDTGATADFTSLPNAPMMQTLSADTVRTSAIDSVYSSAVGNVYFTASKGGQIYKADAITSFDMTINGNGATLKVVGSTVSPDVTLGKVQVSGGLSVYFKDNTLYNSFTNSDDLTVIAYFSENSANTINSSFMNFILPRVKLGSASKDDAQSIVLTTQYQALIGDGTTGFEQTTMEIQDYAQLA